MSARLVRQPERSSLCGQACVAMAAGVCLEEAVRAVGHRRATGTRELVAALKRLGVRSSGLCQRINRSRPAYPARAIVRIRKPRHNRSHWMYLETGVIYDPEDLWPRYDGWRVTSYLEVFG